MAAGAHARLFDLVAAPYDLFFHQQRRSFRRTWTAHGSRLGLPTGARVLDAGCGTGALASVLAQRGFAVNAVDASSGMRAVAARRLRGSGVALSDGDPLRGLPFADGAFDLVVCSHVIHGFPAPARAVFFREALRVSRGLVLFHDFPPRSLRPGWLDVRAIETLEGSDYRRFVRTGAAEMRRVFDSVDVFMIGIGSAWYVCRGVTPPPPSGSTPRP
jgi:ubiquinone/menaquinone biosynthesis C-methylase UbiE